MSGLRAPAEVLPRRQQWGFARIASKEIPMPANRSLEVTVHFTGSQASDGSYSGAATYFQTGSSHPLTLVAPTGDINLESLQHDPDYNWAIGMTFKLDATVVDRHGNAVACTWASPLSRACAITGPGAAPATGMAVSQPHATQIHIANINDDRDKAHPDDRSYDYKLGVMLPSVDNYFISLDPKITNTGPLT